MKLAARIRVVAALLALGCSDTKNSAVIDAAPAVSDAAPAAADARPIDAPTGPDARILFPDAGPGGVACAFAVNAACNTNRSDYSCLDSAWKDGWSREDVLNLDCPNGTAAAPCGGAATQPYVVSVIRLCKTGGSGMAAPCADGTMPTAGPAGCAVCETLKLDCK